jgi:plastocyanin
VRRAFPVALAAALLAAPAAEAAVTTVGMPGRFFDPARVTVVSGDRVVWRNTDLVAHDVRDTGGAFQSGPIARFGAFSHDYGAPGGYPFLCTIHPFMTGQVDVLAASLSGPADEAVAGEQVSLAGRAPAGTASVSIEAQDAAGAWRAVTAAAPGPDGTFAATVAPAEPTTYRAVTAAGASPSVAVRVSASVMLHVHVHKRRYGRHVAVRTEPARPGLEVAIYRWDRWRYAWKRKGHATLNQRGRAGLRMTRRGGIARLELTRPGGRAVLGESEPFKLRNGRPAKDPTPGAHGGEPHH